MKNLLRSILLQFISKRFFFYSAYQPSFPSDIAPLRLQVHPKPLTKFYELKEYKRCFAISKQCFRNFVHFGVFQFECRVISFYFGLPLFFLFFNVKSYARENSLSYCKIVNILLFTTLQVISHVNTSYDPSSAKKTVQGSKVCA